LKTYEGIWLNGKNYSHGDALTLDPLDPKFNPFEQDVLAFYQLWFSEAENFEFKTSGTTGEPKIITFERKDLIRSANISISTFKLQTGHNILLCLSPQYVAGKMMMVRAFVGGLPLIAIDPQLNQFAHLDRDIEFAAFVPNQVSGILNDSLMVQKFEGIKKVIIGGGEINNDDFRKLKQLKNNVYQTYSMTETLTHVAIRKVSGSNSNDYYNVLKSFSISTDERGCLKVKSPYQSDWLQTNDLVKVIDEKRFIWKGRVDNVVNSGGIKIIPEEIEKLIESVFNSLNLDHNFFVAGLPDKLLGNKLVLFIEGELIVNQEGLLEKLNTNLPNYKSPKEIILIRNFHYTLTGKINRSATVKSIYNVD